MRFPAKKIIQKFREQFFSIEINTVQTEIDTSTSSVKFTKPLINSRVILDVASLSDTLGENVESKQLVRDTTSGIIYQLLESATDTQTLNDVDKNQISWAGAGAGAVDELIKVAADGKTASRTGKIIVSTQSQLKTALALTEPLKIEVTQDVTVSGTVTFGAFHIVKGSILTFADEIIFSSTSVTGAVLDANCNFLGNAVYTSSFNSTLYIRLLTGTPTFTKTLAATLNLRINSVESLSSVTSTAGTLNLDDENYWGLSGGGLSELTENFMLIGNSLNEPEEIQTREMEETRFNLKANKTEVKLAQDKLFVGGIDGFVEERVTSNLGTQNSGNYGVKLAEGKVLRGDANGDAIEEIPVQLFDLASQSDISADATLNLEGLSETLGGIPDNYMIESITFEETAGFNAGNISIGTTALGTDVVNAQTVNANEKIMKVPLIAFFGAAQTLYISSSAWGDGVIKVSIFIRRVC